MKSQFLLGISPLMINTVYVLQYMYSEWFSIFELLGSNGVYIEIVQSGSRESFIPWSVPIRLTQYTTVMFYRVNVIFL